MGSGVSFLLISLALAAAVRDEAKAASERDCPVTKAPAVPFIPPQPWEPYTGRDSRFLLGGPDLWVLVNTHWWLNATGNKLPYFSQVFSGNDPRLAVMARRLDGPGPLVWAKWVNSAGPSFVWHEGPESGRGGGAMITSLKIPTTGCWEISAHYTPVRDKVETVTYTVWVEDRGFPAPRN